MKKDKIEKEETFQTSVRIPVSLFNKGIKKAKKKKWSLTAVIVEALKEYLNK